ncbi:MAG: hypothetical protein CYPHOPRED_003323 [Cyphobasidiales sp. Tagirdzhanova-0007]|nr:MAG: hypothetical protein CYPHOPRED_003323 [Cyphobasidiales sp. Tagirdzhanova-0007]
MSQGDPTGFGFHGDFYNGWDGAVLDKAIKDCDGGPNGSGQTNICPFFTTQTQDEMVACRKEGDSPDLGNNEQVAGWLDKLPGCNPVTVDTNTATNGMRDGSIFDPTKAYPPAADAAISSNASAIPVPVAPVYAQGTPLAGSSSPNSDAAAISSTPSESTRYKRSLNRRNNVQYGVKHRLTHA